MLIHKKLLKNILMLILKKNNNNYKLIKKGCFHVIQKVEFIIIYVQVKCSM